MTSTLWARPAASTACIPLDYPDMRINIEINHDTDSGANYKNEILCMSFDQDVLIRSRKLEGG